MGALNVPNLFDYGDHTASRKCCGPSRNGEKRNINFVVNDSVQVWTLKGASQTLLTD